MHVHKNLSVVVPIDRQAEFIDQVEKSLPKGWHRDHDQEVWANSLDIRPSHHGHFIREATTDMPTVLVAFSSDIENSSLRVWNIVPKEISQLTIDQYNRFIDEFHLSCLASIAAKFGYAIKVTGDRETLKDWVCHESYECFRRFSVLSNRSTGTSHPSDQKHWFDFVISVFEHGDKLYSSDLQRWMVEDDKWDEDTALDIAIQYEQQLELLNYYRNRR